MFGYIGSPCSGCQAGAARTYRAFFCGLCNRLRGDYGLPARFLVNRDSTFLSIFSTAQMADGPAVSVSTCCNPLGRKREHFETGPAVTYASAVTVFGLETKLRDNAEDESGWKRATAQGLLSGAQSAFERARRTLRDYGVDPGGIDENFGEQSEREQAFASGDRDIDLITTPTSTAYSGILASASLLPGNTAALPLPAVEQFGHHFGALVYLLDAAQDHDRDQKSGAFNPVHYVGLPAVADATLHRVQALESVTGQLQTGLIRFGDLFGQLAGSLRATAENVLDPESESQDSKKRKKKRKSKKKESCCDCHCCDCCNCCDCCDCCPCGGKRKGDGCDCDCPCCCCD